MIKVKILGAFSKTELSTAFLWKHSFKVLKIQMPNSHSKSSVFMVRGWLLCRFGSSVGFTCQLEIVKRCHSYWPCYLVNSLKCRWLYPAVPTTTMVAMQHWWSVLQRPPRLQAKNRGMDFGRQKERKKNNFYPLSVEFQSQKLDVVTSTEQQQKSLCNSISPTCKETD